MPLAHPFQRRQDVHHTSSHESPSPSPSPPPFSSYSSNLNSLFLGNNKIANFASQASLILDPNCSSIANDSYCIDSRHSTPSDLNFGVADTPYMQNSSSHYPQVRVQQSATNGLLSATTPPPMVEDFSQQSWNNTYQDNAYLVPSPPQNQYNSSLSYRSHKRLPSDSSIASLGPDSPYNQSTTYPRIVDPDVQSVQSAHLENWEPSYSNIGQYSKSAYGQSSNSDQFYIPALQNFNPVTNDAISMTPTRTAMSQAMNQQRVSNTNGAQSAQRRTFGGGVDSSSDVRSNTPQLDRTVSDAYQDELYNPRMAQSAPSSNPRQQQAQSNTVPPHRSAISELLHAANRSHITERSASPAVNVSRQRSPFTESSQFAVDGAHSNPSSPAGATRLTSATQLRLQQKKEADDLAYAQHHPLPRSDYFNPPKTISPKEAHLDFDNTEENNKMPVYPTIKREPRFSSHNRLPRGNTDESSYSDQKYPSMATSRRESSSSSAPRPSGPAYQLMPSSVPAMPQQYPFISESRRQSSSMRSGSDQAPEFPASLTSMESTRSEAGQAENVKITPETDESFRSPPSSQEAPLSRPAHTTASSGTYTCITADCHARFDTAIRLSKHRREAHPPSPSYASTPTTPVSATHNTQAAANNISRNNAPGPHKCEKVNPQTGKACNTSFSRSYDLTRHEETIHNNRKQKVRCHLCTEEKTFSRNDALTRHMRVVHPDVDFPGKVRRGRNEGVDVVRQRIETGRGGR